jgi:hypothetical protein
MSVFQPVFDALQQIFKPYEPSLCLVDNQPDRYYLDTPAMNGAKKGEFFVMVAIKKNYVSVHLMPVYLFPVLLENISEALKKQMQGKSCFNFKKIDLVLLEELGQLVKKCFEYYQTIQKI